MSNNTGGPAFPSWKEDGFFAYGMTLRDYFAAKAMPSILPRCATYTYAAQECYAIADAMLKERG